MDEAKHVIKEIESIPFICLKAISLTPLDHTFGCLLSVTFYQSESENDITFKEYKFLNIKDCKEVAIKFIDHHLLRYSFFNDTALEWKKEIANIGLQGVSLYNPGIPWLK